jgi:hypothetical protein
MRRRDIRHTLLRTTAREAVTGAVDSSAMLRRRDGVASRWTDDGQVSWLSQAEITLYRGQDASTDPAPSR